MDILGLRRKALGHVYRDNWGGSSSNEGGSSTSSSGYGSGSTGGGGGSSLGNISPGSNISPESQAQYGGSSGTVEDQSIALVTPLSAEAQAAYTAKSAAESTAVASSAPNGGSGGSWSNLFSKQNLKSGLTVLKGGALVQTAAVNPVAALLGAIAGYVSGEWESVKFSMGSPAPSTTVASTTGASKAMSDWSGGAGSGFDAGRQSTYGSQVIGWQGSVINRAPAAKSTALASAPSDFLGLGFLQPTTKTALQAPQGATGEAAPSNSTGLVGLAIGLGLLAFMS